MTTQTGRPAKGRPPVGPEVKIAFQPELLAEIDRLAKAAGMTRSAWVRYACRACLPDASAPGGKS